MHSQGTNGRGDEVSTLLDTTGTDDLRDRSAAQWESLKNGVVSGPETSNIYGTGHRRWVLGIFCIVVLAFIWTFSSILVQYIFSEGNFQKPFFLTYVANSLVSLNLLAWASLRIFGLVPSVHWSNGVDDRVKAYVAGVSPPTSLYSVRQTAKVSMIIAPLWFVALWSYNISLGVTSVSSNTIISTTSTLFTFLLSAWLLGEKATCTKVGGFLLCMLGNVLTALHDGYANDTFWGDVICLFSAFMYGVYVTAVRIYVPDDTFVSLFLFLGTLGLLIAIFGAPVVLLFHVSGLESLAGLSWNMMGLLVLKGLTDNVISDYLWAKAVLLTSPTVATVGLSLTVPMALVSDLLLHGISPTVLSFSGATCVLVGFVFVSRSHPTDYKSSSSDHSCASKDAFI